MTTQAHDPSEEEIQDEARAPEARDDESSVEEAGEADDLESSHVEASAEDEGSTDEDSSEEEEETASAFAEAEDEGSSVEEDEQEAVTAALPAAKPVEDDEQVSYQELYHGALEDDVDEPAASPGQAAAAAADPVEEKNPFDTAEFVENPEPRCPCVLLVDSSAAMEGEALRELNEGLQRFQKALCADELVSKRVEVAVVSFGPAKLETEFRTADTFEPPTLEAEGEVTFGDAVEMAIELVGERKRAYRSAGINFYRPWILLLTKGDPTGDWAYAADAIRQGEKDGAFAFFTVGVGEADLLQLATLSTREPLRLKGFAFAELFAWLSESLQSVSHSQLDSKVNLPSPMGWAQVG